MDNERKDINTYELYNDDGSTTTYTEEEWGDILFGKELELRKLTDHRITEFSKYDKEIGHGVFKTRSFLGRPEMWLSAENWSKEVQKMYSKG